MASLLEWVAPSRQFARRFHKAEAVSPCEPNIFSPIWPSNLLI